MLFKRASRTSAETAFIVVQNVSGSTMTAGYSCVFDVGTSVNGVRVSQADTADLQAFAGVIHADLANSAYGLCQVYGYRAAAYVTNSVGANLSGSNLKTVNGSWALEVSAAVGTAKAFAFLCEAIADSGDSSSQFLSNKKIFVRAL